MGYAYDSERLNGSRLKGLNLNPEGLTVLFHQGLVQGPETPYAYWLFGALPLAEALLEHLICQFQE